MYLIKLSIFGSGYIIFYWGLWFGWIMDILYKVPLPVQACCPQLFPLISGQAVLSHDFECFFAAHIATFLVRTLGFAPNQSFPFHGKVSPHILKFPNLCGNITVLDFGSIFECVFVY